MKKVIIIGASSGIGEKLALYYAKMGCMVGIAARRVELLADIANKYPDKIIYELIDVTDIGDNGAVKRLMTLIERLAGVDLIIYCSGAGVQNAMLDTSKELNTLNVNVTGFMFIVTAAFDYFSKRVVVKGGIDPQFVVISSIASIKGLGVAASYSASKRFQITYIEALAQLAHKRGFQKIFTTILPGFVDTNFIKGRHYPMTMSLDYAVKHIVSAIDKRCSYKIVDWRWAIVAFIWKLIPGSIWRRIRL